MYTTQTRDDLICLSKEAYFKMTILPDMFFTYYSKLRL